MEKLTVTRVFISDKGKDGKPFTTQKGKPFWKVGILTDKYGENVWLTTLAFEVDSPAKQLKAGDEITVIVEEKNGFKNFSLPTKTDLLEDRVSALEAQMRKLTQEKYVSPEAEAEGIDPSNIPF